MNMKKIGIGLMIAYFAIASYSNVKREVRYWLGYPPSCITVIDKRV
jgi:hypothetical protein